MAAHVSAVEDLVLHAPRVLGFASAARIAARYALDPDVVEDTLLDFAARGWVAHSGFAGSAGWFLTDLGRSEDEGRMTAELDRAGARDVVVGAHARFAPLNGRFGRACTDWQIRPTRVDAMAFNDHTDWAWDERVLRTLDSLARQLAEVAGDLAECLQRFDGYAARYASALARVNAAQRRWVDAPEIDSCHTVWIQLHEDLLATLGIARGSDA
jgi:hypothetical protein